MKERGLIPSPPSCHGIIFASFKHGGKSAARAVLQDFQTVGLPLTEASALLAMKIMIPSQMVQLSDSLASAQLSLRTLGASNESIQPAALDLMRSLRRCELAELRQPSGGLTERAVKEGRITVWQSVLEHLLTLADLLESTNVRSTKDTSIKN